MIIPKNKNWHNEYMQAVKNGKVKPGRIDAAHGLFDIGWNACIEEIKRLNPRLKFEESK